MKRYAAIVAVVMLAVAAGAWVAAEVPEDVKTLVQKRCAGCHKGNFAPAGLNLEPASLGAIVGKASAKLPDRKIVDPKEPAASYLLKKVRRDKDIAGKPMPPGQALAAEELRALEAWIAGLK